MAAGVAPGLQLHLVAAQTSAHGLQDALAAALDACGIAAAGTTAALRRLLLERGNAAAVLAAAANASGHPCAPGILLARLLSGSLVSAGELLAAADPADLALAVGELHAASRSSALPAPAAAAAKQAFVALIKMLATSGDGAEQRSATEHVMAHLRRAWLAPAAAAGISSRSFNGDGALLLAAAVDAVDAEVFPRQLAHSWLVAELGHVLRSPAAEGHQPPQQQAGAAGSEAGPGGSWAAAMAAFGAALPAEALLKLAQAAAGEGRLHPQRTAALLAAAAQQHHGARPLVEQWVAQQATQALARPAAPALRALILLQRALLLWSGGAAAAPAASTAQQAQQQQQQQQQSAQQAYKQWFAATLLAPAQHPHLQFLVQQVLIPLVPEEGSGCAWLQAQADVLAGLLRLAQQPGAAPLPQAASRAAEEYLEAAKQRLKAEQAAAAAAGGDQVGAGGPAAPLTNMQKGQALVAAMLREFEDNGGELRSGTLNQMQAKASNVFTRGEIHNMLLPALLAPTDDELEAQRRAGLVQYLYQELGRRGDSQIRPHLKPEVLALFHRRCLQAQLEGASLLQLAERAPQLLMAGGSAAEDPAGSSGGSGSGGISSHQVIDKLGRLVGEDLQRWHSQQEQRRPGSGSRHASGGASVGSPDELAAVLLDIWMAAFCSRSGSGSADGGSSGNSGPSPAAVAAHLLSIAHAHPQLHAPLLHRLQQRLLGSGPEQPAAAQHAQQLEAAAMLATVAGALVQQRGSGSSGGTHAAAAGPGALQPLFVWQQEPFEAAAAAAAEAEPPAAATVPGPLWLQQQLLALPLSDAAAMARSAGVAAAHLSCLRHFAQHCLLPGVGDGSSSSSSSSRGSATALALRWQHGAAASAGSYDGEFVAGLVLPACAAAVRLLQWLLLRLSVGSQLLPGSQGQGSSNSGGRAAKRPRNAAGAAAEAAADCDGVMEACSRALRSEKGASLAMSAGGLPLADYLRLEASAGSSSSTDLLPAGAAEAALRLCCALYLQPGGSSSELASLVQPLIGAPAGGGGGRPAGAYVDEGDVLTIPDSEEEDELPAAGAATSSSSSLEEALGAATAAVLAGAAQQQAASAAAAALSVCQRACGHSLRLLAAAPGSDGLPSLLVQLLASAAQHSRQQLAVRAVAPAGQQPGSGQWQQGQQAAVQLRLTDPQQAGRVQQAVAALSSGLTLELLPLPLAGSATLEGQQRRLAAVAGVVQWALSDAGLSAPPAEVQRQLVAALESA